MQITILIRNFVLEYSNKMPIPKTVQTKLGHTHVCPSNYNEILLSEKRKRKERKKKNEDVDG